MLLLSLSTLFVVMELVLITTSSTQRSKHFRKIKDCSFKFGISSANTANLRLLQATRTFNLSNI